MGAFIVFSVGVSSSFAVYLNAKCGILGYLWGELSANSALLLPHGKEGSWRGAVLGAEHMEHQDAACLLGFPSERKKNPNDGD